MSAVKQEYIAIGKMGASWGLQGDVKFKFYNAKSEVLNKTRFVYLKAGFVFQKLKVLNFRPQGKFFLLRLENYFSPETAKVLQGLEVFVSRDQLLPQKKGEFYIHDLIGMEVLDEQGQVIGILKAVENYGSADLLKVASQDLKNPQEYLIPWIPDVIVKIEEESGQIIIRRLEGLL